MISGIENINNFGARCLDVYCVRSRIKTTKTAYQPKVSATEFVNY